MAASDGGLLGVGQLPTYCIQTKGFLYKTKNL